ncbi:MAG: extracellular solute-binding protein [Chloroflexi bacterium]|nr:extracellular solute-binding protein [Chloroflexota bacterium]
MVITRDNAAGGTSDSRVDSARVNARAGAIVAAYRTRRGLFGASAAGLASGVVIACAGGSGGAGGSGEAVTTTGAAKSAKLTGKLTFWSQSGSFSRFTEGIGAAQIRSFRELHPQLDLDVQDILPGGVTQHIEKLYASAIGGEIADLYLASRNAIPELAVNGTAVALDEYVKRSQALKREDMWGSHIADASWKGKLYGITHSTGVWVLFLNDSLWREVGLNPAEAPKTWDDLEVVARKAMRTGATPGKVDRVGYHPTWHNGGVVTWLMHLRQLGGDYFTADFQPAFGGDQGIRALEFMKRFVDLHGGWQALAEVQQEVAGAVTVRNVGWNFGSGRIATQMDAHTIMATLRRDFPETKYDVAPLPVPKGGKRSGLQGGTALAIAPQSKQREAAWALIEHLMKPEHILRFSEDLDRIPSRRSVASSAAYLQKDPTRKVLIDEVPHSHWLPPVPGNSEIQTIVAGIVNDALQGKRSVREALQQGEAQAKAWIDKWRQYL